jgi:hypothetical protein
MQQSLRPTAHEFELSVFGPGIGECLVLHLGNQEWVVIDSCLDDVGEPVGLEYLRKLRIDPAKSIKVIAVTHWHDDHIQGIAKTFRHATSAEFACSAALRCEEFYALVSMGKDARFVEKSSGIDELGEVLDEIQIRKSGLASPDHFMSAGSVIFQGVHARITAVSPSAGTIASAHKSLAARITELKSIMGRVRDSRPNDLSAALIVETKHHNLLLGGDLEKGRDLSTGWNAVLQSKVIPTRQSSAYKVAHHGSEGADLMDLWHQLLLANPGVLLTPYAGGRKKLPSREDVKRIKSFSDSVFCTVWPSSMPPPVRRKVDKTINQVARNRCAIRKKPGQIRLRYDMRSATAVPQIDCFDGARKL